MTEQCAFCGTQSQLVKSHIIPKGLYWGLQDDKTRSPVIVSPHDGEFQARKPNGIWDQFLCDTHEKQFNAWDTHAVEVLRIRDHREVIGGWQYSEFEYDKLKLFFLSMLWRAHSTRDSFFDRVNLGAHADRIRHLIESKSPGRQSEYAILLWRSDEPIAKVVIAPFCERHEGLRFVCFYLPSYMVLIKVDQRPLPALFRGHELPASDTWFVARRVYTGGSEEQAMRLTAKINLDKKNANRD